MVSMISGCGVSSGSEIVIPQPIVYICALKGRRGRKSHWQCPQTLQSRLLPLEAIRVQSCCYSTFWSKDTREPTETLLSFRLKYTVADWWDPMEVLRTELWVQGASSSGHFFFHLRMLT